jgi:hypothetical protein
VSSLFGYSIRLRPRRRHGSAGSLSGVRHERSRHHHRSKRHARRRNHQGPSRGSSCVVGDDSRGASSSSTAVQLGHCRRRRAVRCHARRIIHGCRSCRVKHGAPEWQNVGQTNDTCCPPRDKLAQVAALLRPRVQQVESRHDSRCPRTLREGG